MLKRTVVGLILVIVLLAVTLWAPQFVLALFVSVLSAIAVNEFLFNTSLVKGGRLRLYTAVMAFLVPLWCYFGCNNVAALISIIAFYMLLVSELLVAKTKLPFSQIGLCMVAGLLIPYLFSSLVRISLVDHGRYFIMLPFTVAFMTDIGAYLIGISIGKHKLCPVVSPKKTVEGFFGGIAFAIMGTVGYAVVLQTCFGFQVNYFFAAVYAVVGSLAGVMCDLSLFP